MESNDESKLRNDESTSCECNSFFSTDTVYTLTPQILPIPEIIIQGYKYSPQPDITTYELSKLLHLFIIITNSHSGSHLITYNTLDFIKENKLERHFVRTQN